MRARIHTAHELLCIKRLHACTSFLTWCTVSKSVSEHKGTERGEGPVCLSSSRIYREVIMMRLVVQLVSQSALNQNNTQETAESVLRAGVETRQTLFPRETWLHNSSSADLFMNLFWISQHFPSVLVLFFPRPAGVLTLCIKNQVISNLIWSFRTLHDCNLNSSQIS